MRGDRGVYKHPNKIYILLNGKLINDKLIFLRVVVELVLSTCALVRTKGIKMAKQMAPMSIVISTAVTSFPTAVSHRGSQPGLRLREYRRIMNMRLDQRNA